MTANEAISSLDCRWLVGRLVEVPLLVVGRNPLRIKCSRHNPGSFEYYYYYYYLSAGIAFICQDDPPENSDSNKFLINKSKSGEGGRGGHERKRKSWEIERIMEMQKPG